MTTLDNQFKELLKDNNIKKLYNDKNEVNGPIKYILNYKTYIKIYKKLFLKYNLKNKKVIDFGCGPAFSVYVGKFLFNLDISGIDIHKNSGSNDFIYEYIHNVLNINKYINHYDGININNIVDKYDVIICYWSFLFDYSNEYGKSNYIYPTNTNGKELLIKKIKLLLSISNYNSHWIISPPKFWNKDIDSIFNNYNNKNIKLILEK